MPPVDPNIARKTWRTLEPYHGLVYFAPEAAERYAELGVEGFGGYFNSRAAAMGEVGAEVVVATFFNFRPSLPRGAIPKGWAAAPPSAWLDARLAGIDAALRRAIGDERIGDDVGLACRRAGGRALPTPPPRSARVDPLAAAHAAVPRPDEPHLALWHAVTVLREHRGDGHVACLVGAGVDGCEALVQHAAAGDVPAPRCRRRAGWTDDEWDAAVARLAERGWVERRRQLHRRGPRHPPAHRGPHRRARRRPVARRSARTACEELRALVRPLSKAIVEGGAFGLR